MKKSTLSLKKILSITPIVLLVSFLALMLIVVYLTNFSPEAICFDPQRLINVNGGFEMLDINEQLLPELAPIKTLKKVSLSELPEHVKNAFIAVEDKRFYRHHGIDGIRILGAIKNNILSGRSKEGASTITQQLVKNVFLSGEKNLSRKLNEIRLAKEVERRYTKDEIMEIYLNTIYFGNNAYGIQTAAQTYFDIPASLLSVSQSAMLAGMIKAPTSYAPNNDLDKCIRRRNTVLKLMLEQKFISSEQYTAAKNESIDLLLINKDKSFYKRYMHGAIQEACEILDITEKQLSDSRLKIYTYYDKNAQQALLNAVENAEALTVNGNKAQLCGVLLDNKTCGISAFVGYGKNNMYTMKRSIGSCIKPLAVYAPALNERLITPATAFNDIRRSYGNYSPKNYGDKYYGLVTVRQAVTHSLNSISVLLMNELTPQLSRAYLSKMGISTDKNDNNLSLALGSFTYGVELVRLTEAYACLANGGMHSKATFIKRITDEKGNCLYTHKPQFNRALQSDSAFLMTDMLRSVTLSGTAKELGKRLDFQLAAKTGTVGLTGSKDNTDALVVSYNTQNTLTFWAGGYDGDALPSSVTGGSLPTHLSAEVYSSLYKKRTPPSPFIPPDSVTKLPIDLSTLKEGLSAEIIESPSDGKAFYEYFSLRNIPKSNKATELPTISDFSISIENGYPLIKAKTQADSFIELHRIYGDKDVIIARLDGKEIVYIDKDAICCREYVYYAIPIMGDIRGQATEQIKLTLPQRKNDDTTPDDKWWKWTKY